MPGPKDDPDHLNEERMAEVRQSSSEDPVGAENPPSQVMQLVGTRYPSEDGVELGISVRIRNLTAVV